VELKIEENVVEFTPSFEDKNNEILVTFDYGESEEVATNLKLRVLVRLTEKNQPVLTLERLEGNVLYSKLLMNDIKNQFKQL